MRLHSGWRGWRLWRVWFLFFSPCIFPLVPAYIAQLTGGTIADGAVHTDRRTIMVRSSGFIMGFTVIFLLLGASTTFIGQGFSMYSGVLEQIGGILIIIFGLQMTGIISIRALFTEKRIRKPKRSSSFLGSFGFGLVFASGWTPCVGIVLASVLSIASSQLAGEVAAGMGMLLLYSMGLGIPFIVVSLVFSQSINRLSSMNRWLPGIQKVSGGLLVVLGVLLFTGQFQHLSNFLARISPGWL
ncbi:cytochrome c biogenesis CcdA family protein [Geomicrobium sp. JCM 19039]|uniref:cytochrome c biogenesis CcdA family protein n=1 Tax=Geomicrobium sp. JCM 19039 TaxID=1460636 RepID=UPI0027D78C75|nr:cytochrome c biogenesis protein CcdA [Geomicrobium sp. JCM 19039]